MCHQSVKYGRNFKCPFEDFIFIVLYVLHHECTRHAAVFTKFGIPLDMTLEEFGGWCREEKARDGEYFKGLEVFLWFCEEWLKRGGSELKVV